MYHASQPKQNASLEQGGIEFSTKLAGSGSASTGGAGRAFGGLAGSGGRAGLGFDPDGVAGPGAPAPRKSRFTGGTLGGFDESPRGAGAGGLFDPGDGSPGAPSQRKSRFAGGSLGGLAEAPSAPPAHEPGGAIAEAAPGSAPANGGCGGHAAGIDHISTPGRGSSSSANRISAGTLPTLADITGGGGGEGDDDEEEDDW